MFLDWDQCDVSAVITRENEIIQEGTNEVRVSSGSYRWKEGACRVCCYGVYGELR